MTVTFRLKNYDYPIVYTGVSEITMRNGYKSITMHLLEDYTCDRDPRDFNVSCTPFTHILQNALEVKINPY